MASYDVDNPEVVNFITQSPNPEKVATGRDGDLRHKNRSQKCQSGRPPSSEDAIIKSGEIRDEETPLLGTEIRHNVHRCHSCCNKRICIRSKPALLVLLWNFFVAFGVQEVVSFTVDNLGFATSLSSAQTVYVGVSISAGLLLLFPLAIVLADIKFKRHKTILASICFAFISAFIVYIGIMLWVIFWQSFLDDTNICFTVLCYAISCAIVGFGGIVFLIGYIAFTANVIQFGVDQLHIHNVCAHKESSVLFVHWYVWTSNLGIFMWKLDWSTFIYYLLTDSDHYNGLLLLSSSLIALIVIGLSLCFAYRERHLFPVQLSSTNPYNLVYQVMKYSVQHSRQQTIHTIFLRLNLDVGKEKHGGPFKGKQVEDVKVYAKTFCILLTLGPIFTVNIAASSILSIFSTHMNVLGDSNYYGQWIFSYTDLLTSILIVLIIPFYLCVVGPWASVYTPGRLRRIGIGIILIIFSLICPLLIDIIGHKRRLPNSIICFLASDFNPNNDYPDDPYIHINSWFIIFSYILNAFAHIFLDIATYEFICITSPYSMRGLFFGTLYAIKGIFQFFAVVIVLLPFNSWSREHSFPSCGFVYFLINIVIALTGLVVYIYAARKCRFLKREDSEDNAGLQVEVDHDDLNVNVETIA